MLVLKAKLLYWRVRYRLSGLDVKNGTIVARVNPEAVVDTSDPANIGAALLPILQQVEARYQSEVESGAAVDEEFDDIMAARDYRRGGGEKSEGVTVFDRENMARWLSPNDRSYASMIKTGKKPSRKLSNLERARGLGNVISMDVADAMGGSEYYRRTN